MYDFVEIAPGLLWNMGGNSIEKGHIQLYYDFFFALNSAS